MPVPHFPPPVSFATRGLKSKKSWIEQTLREPDLVEEKGSRRSFFKRLPGRRIMLRVVTPVSDPEYVITAYFDRKKPCA